MLDETHDPGLQSWVESANSAETDFPIQNLPFGVFRHSARQAIGVAIGDRVLDVSGCVAAGVLESTAARACASPPLNGLMAAGAPHRVELRRELSRVLSTSSDRVAAMRPHLLSLDEVEMLVPAHIGDYTDFYASVHHATRVGALFRPDNPLLPNYKHVPIAYHGRSSSIVVSRTPVRRPCGQVQAGDALPEFRPTQALDYELELGLWVGPGNTIGERIPIALAEDHLFGLGLVNDWSARDIQRWEYQPLGPFLAKNFATSVSPWIVTVDALAPFRASAERAPDDPEPLEYLRATGDRAFDITLEVWLRSAAMSAPMRVSRTSFRHMFWTPAQMIAHHSSNGCNLRPGDLLASGTVSGPERGEGGCLLELSSGGKEPVQLVAGESRRFLEDGDEVVLRARAERSGFRAIGFGTCVGIVVPATA